MDAAAENAVVDLGAQPIKGGYSPALIGLLPESNKLRKGAFCIAYRTVGAYQKTLGLPRHAHQVLSRALKNTPYHTFINARVAVREIIQNS